MSVHKANDSNRNKAKKDREKARNKKEPVCKYWCDVIPENGKKYTIGATTKKRMFNKQNIHADSFPSSIVTFSDIRKTENK